MHYLYYGNGFEGLYLLHGVLQFVLFVGVLLVIGLAIRHFMHIGVHDSDSISSTKSQALEILKERYAKGEIDTKDYEERKEVLTK